jgi:predicted MFS family arabinose efflux permease
MRPALPEIRVPQSAWRPLRHQTFAILWTATVVSNVGGWMYAAASAWLMTTLDGDPLMVSLVQVATTLPMFLIALPAGALSDIVDRRHFLIAAEVFITVTSTTLALLIWLELITPARLLLLTFLIEAGAAATAPPWQSIVPELVPREDLSEAVALDGVGVNVSRAVGPAVGGILISSIGIATPFWVNAVANLGTIGSLWWWRPTRVRGSHLPAEHFVPALRVGMRHVRHNSSLVATLVRAVGFVTFASCYWALLPLVARVQLGGGASLYGILLGALGASAIASAFMLPRMRSKLGAHHLVVIASICTAFALALFAVAHDAITALAASVIAGACWLVVLSTLNVSAQFALPEWVRGRGIAAYVTIFFGAMALGSAVWGEIARLVGVPAALFIAAAGQLLTIPVTLRWKLQSDTGSDLRPSMHWPMPVASGDVAMDQGPARVLIEYRVRPENRSALLQVLNDLSHERGRDGAYGWGLFADVADRNRIVETFLSDSWLEHLRQHERVTNADRRLEQRIAALVLQPPKIVHLMGLAGRPG